MTRAESQLFNKQTNIMNKQEKINDIVANAIQLRYQILGVSVDEELSEDLQQSFDNLSLALLDLEVEFDISRE